MIAAAMVLALALQQSASPPAPSDAAKSGADALAVQVALDRAGFSPGVLDGRMGAQTKSALTAYKEAHKSEPPSVEPLSRYRITEADAAGPFAKHIPDDLVEQAKLDSLAYRTLLEALAERYHATPALLQRLNPKATFAAGEEIVVPNVDPMLLPATMAKPEGKLSAADRKARTEAAKERAEAKPDLTVTVSKSSSTLTVTDAGGALVMYAPVTTGSAKDPLPLGTWKVNGVGLFPEFRYNPDLFWDADPAHTKALIPPGPNNPVGLVWIDITKEHYGLHGTPEPARIGRSESHGCVRLTNWDALRLASLVKPGTTVVFRE